MIDLKLTAGGEDTAATALAEFSPRPKRKYTVTERVLAASRANLERANAVPREIRYRPTEKRRRACHRNLTLAVIAKKRDRSPRYATCFRNGWYVADPERALPLVGATPEEYHRHLDAWRREILPRDATEEKLAHAIGMLSWRWIAGVRLECDLETLKICRLLDGLAAERRPAGAEGGLLPVTAGQLRELGYDVGEVLTGWNGLEEPLDRIRNRMLRLWQEILRWRGEPLMDLKGIGCFGRQQAVAVDHEMHSPFELADPFLACDRTEATLCPKPDPVAPVERWAPRQQSAVDSQQSGAVGADLATILADSKIGERGSAPAKVEDAFWTSTGDLARLSEARRLGRELPGSFDSFLERVEAAIGMPPSGGDENPEAKSGAGESGPAARRWARGVRWFARAVWNSLQTLRNQAGRLWGLLDQGLGDYSNSLVDHRAPEWTARQTLEPSVLKVMDEPERRTERRGEDLAQLYAERARALARVMFRRWQRWKAAMAALCGTG